MNTQQQQAVAGVRAKHPEAGDFSDAEILAEMGLEDPASPVHIVNDMPYVRAICGALIGQDNWTDAVIELVKDIEEDHAIAEHYCSKCLEGARKICAESDRYDAIRRREIVREEGMLNGIESANDWQEALA